MMTRFTVCIPTYNRLYTIENALLSLEKQTFEDFEVLIIDDGSTDKTELFINEYKLNTRLNIRYYKKVNGGKYTALNIGIKEAAGEFFIILDSDDTLTEYALERLNSLWVEIPEEDKPYYCGVMGRSRNKEGQMIGTEFPQKYFVSSYVDFHFISGAKIGPYGDCCEFIKTNILKKYSYPEYENLKFMPEAYILDQIGIKYKLLCVNEIFKIVEYLPDGITTNIEFQRKENIVGYLEHYVSLIDKVFIQTKESIPLKSKIKVWWNYWNMVFIDSNKHGNRCYKVSFLGKIIFILMPILNKLHKR